MKSILMSFILLIGTSLMIPAYAIQGDDKSSETTLNSVDAIQALAIANQWNWSRQDIKSYVTTREVVFKFSNGKVKKILLPEDKMVVAIAPYINRTHQ